MALVKFRHDKSMHIERQRRYRLTRNLLIIAGLLIAIFSLVLLLKIDLGSGKIRPVVGGSYTKHVAGPNIYKNNYFSFSDNQKWLFDAKNSSADQFVYISYANGVVAQSLTVYVGIVPIVDNLEATYVLPVNLNNSNLNVSGNITGPCGQTYPVGAIKRVMSINIAGTTMVCVPDSPEYLVIASQVGGTYQLKLRRSNGQLASYIIIYRNLEVYPNPQSFYRIVASFKAM